MKLTIEPPPSQDVLQLKATEKALEFSPVVVKGVPIVRVAYITAAGEGGATAKAVILFNGRNGQFTLQPIDAETPPAKLDFDRPKGEFEKRRESKKEGGRRIAAAANASRQGSETPKP